MGPSLGLFVNVSKCELFGCGDLSSFPPEMKVSRVPNLVILGAPIGDLIFCAKFVAQKRADAAVLLSQLAEEVGAEDPQDVRQCFAECTAVDAADVEWMQAQLSLSRGGLGLRSLSSHCVAAYLASISSSGCDKWNLLVESQSNSLMGGQVEVGSGQGHDRLNSRPADVLVKNWHLGKPAAFDLTITSPLNPTTLNGSGSEVWVICSGCRAVESYGCWGMEAQESFKRLAARLAIQMGCSRSQATTTLYQRLSLPLVRANARALLSRARVHLEEGG
ncbi:hypothetical protein EMCRGX_G001541 [Ephydatia muelleri]